MAATTNKAALLLEPAPSICPGKGTSPSLMLPIKKDSNFF